MKSMPKFWACQHASQLKAIVQIHVVHWMNTTVGAFFLLTPAALGTNWVIWVLHFHAEKNGINNAVSFSGENAAPNNPVCLV